MILIFVLISIINYVFEMGQDRDNLMSATNTRELRQKLKSTGRGKNYRYLRCLEKRRTRFYLT